MQKRQYVNETRAAFAMGVSPYRLRQLVTAGILPRPLRGTTLYDINKLEKAMRTAEGDAEQVPADAKPGTAEGARP